MIRDWVKLEEIDGMRRKWQDKSERRERLARSVPEARVYIMRVELGCWEERNGEDRAGGRDVLSLLGQCIGYIYRLYIIPRYACIHAHPSVHLHVVHSLQKEWKHFVLRIFRYVLLDECWQPCNPSELPAWVI